MPDHPPARDRKRRRRRTAHERDLHKLAQRRYRQTKKDHAIIAPVKVDELLLNYLIDDVRWLKESESRDRKKVGEAIARGLNESAHAKR